MGNITKTAITGAVVTQDHEGCRALFPAFSLVGAGRAAADGMQPLLAVQAIDTGVVRPCRKTNFEPIGFTWWAGRHIDCHLGGRKGLKTVNLIITDRVPVGYGYREDFTEKNFGAAAG